MIFFTLSLLVLIVLLIKRIQSYWIRQGVSEIRPHFFTGNVWEIVTYKKSWGQLILEFYNDFKNKGVKYGGIYFFLKPTFIPLESKVIKDILASNFQCFVNRGLYYNKEYEPISANIVTYEGDDFLSQVFTCDEMWLHDYTPETKYTNMEWRQPVEAPPWKVIATVFFEIAEGYCSLISFINGPRLENKTWKALRANVLPIFTSNQIKNLFRSFGTHTYNLKSSLLNCCEKNNSVDVHKLSASFTTDITVNCLFGMKSNCMENSKCQFLKQGEKITTVTWQKSLTLVLAQLFPRKVCGLLGMRFTDVNVEKFFLDKIDNEVDSRVKHKTTGNDLIDIMRIKNKGNDSTNDTKKYGYSVSEIAAQCFVTFIAGHETTATVLTFSLYELAINNKVQDFLRNDIREVLKKNNGHLTYEALSEMEYLDGVVLETLRKHPVCPVLMRSCNKTYRVPGTNIALNKGTLVNIPVLGLHMDPDNFPNPENFNPERFGKENKKLIKEFTFLPFGGGQRKCIGYRFGILMVKAGIIEVVTNYKISLSKNTKMPVELSPNSFFVTTKDKILINLNKIE